MHIKDYNAHLTVCQVQRLISLGGYTAFPAPGGSVEALIGNADKALYLAKEQRNRAVMFSA